MVLPSDYLNFLIDKDKDKIKIEIKVKVKVKNGKKI
jgi:hypothetical protein